MSKLNTEDEIVLIQNLLKSNSNELAKECIDVLNEEGVLFKSSDKKSKENGKESLLLSYQLKAALENNRGEKTTTGYELLLESLAKTESKHIKIIEITSPKATFFIFSNFEITELIGVLKSNQTLGDIESKLTKL